MITQTNGRIASKAIFKNKETAETLQTPVESALGPGMGST
jgi:hypothetical protein